MRSKHILLGSTCIAVLTLVSGCAVVAVTTTAVAVAGTAVSVGVGAATAVTKGAVSVGSAVLGDDDDDE